MNGRQVHLRGDGADVQAGQAVLPADRDAEDRRLDRGGRVVVDLDGQRGAGAERGQRLASRVEQS